MSTASGHGSASVVRITSRDMIAMPRIQPADAWERGPAPLQSRAMSTRSGIGRAKPAHLATAQSRPPVSDAETTKATT